MKKLILSLTIVAFAIAAQAGDACPVKDKAACPKSAETTKSCCPKEAEVAKAGCCPAGQQTTKNTKKVASPKEGAQVAKK